jgi:tetratricopeptide (TPR) repeat protein
MPFYPLLRYACCAWFVAAGGLSILIPAGCSNTSSDTSPNPTGGVVDPTDSAFENGAHRPPTAQTLFALARILEVQNRDSDASLVLHSIIVRYPTFLPAYCDLAAVQVRQRQVGLAIETLSSGLKISPNDGVLLNDQGMCQVLVHEYPLALQSFTQACACQPDNTRYRTNIAMVLGLMGRYDESLSLYSLVLTPSDAHYNLGVLCNARHDTVRAEKEFAIAKSLASGS